MLKRPEVTIDAIFPLLRDELGASSDAQTLFASWLSQTEAGELPAQIRNELKSVETEIKYSGYLDQQKKSIEKLKRAEERAIPQWFDYSSVSGLSREMQEKLIRVRPATIGQASRIPGVTPAALSLINVYIEIQAKRSAASV
jgi:tRNA uridine 5-carboxymethylaminomethyl modification enzyme